MSKAAKELAERLEETATTYRSGSETLVEVDERVIREAVAPLFSASGPLLHKLGIREYHWDRQLEPEELGHPCPDDLTVEITVGELRALREALGRSHRLRRTGAGDRAVAG